MGTGVPMLLNIPPQLPMSPTGMPPSLQEEKSIQVVPALKKVEASISEGERPLHEQKGPSRFETAFMLCDQGEKYFKPTHSVTSKSRSI